MEATGVKEQFIELRAKGWSYDKIAKELGKAKQTLVDWGRELSEEIASRKALELEALYEKHYLTVQTRVEAFGEILGKLKAELMTRTDLTDVPTEKLLDLFLKYNAVAREEYIEPTFKTSREIQEEKAERYLLDGLTTPLPNVKELKTA